MGPRALGVSRPSPRGANGKGVLKTKMIEPNVKGACPRRVPPPLGGVGVTLAIPQKDTMEMISPEQDYKKYLDTSNPRMFFPIFSLKPN